MSLFLITKDPKLRGSINRQLHLGCFSSNSTEQFKELGRLLETDTHPILLIDENYSERGLVPILETVLSHRLPGPKIFLSGRMGNERDRHFLQDVGFGMLKKPFSIDQLIDASIQMGGLCSVINHLTASQLLKYTEKSTSDWHASLLVGNSEPIVKVRNIIRRIGAAFSSVHINGETGTGKEVVASLLRMESGCPEPYIIVNCSSIPKSLSDTYIFGNERGAYTDAKEARKGFVKCADGGILFLDEIEDLAQDVQGKFLRLLETKLFRPIGSDRTESSQFKLITASNTPLQKLCDDGKLRFDLYNRLNRLIITLPPLRDRKEDLPLLIDHYLKSIGEVRRPDQDTMERIQRYDWPGNVRELFKELEQLSVFAPQDANGLSYTEILTESVLFPEHKTY